METISAKLSELNPEAKREGAEDREQDQDEDEDEKLLRELLEDDEGFSTSALNSTRSRQSRRPERYGTTTSAPAQASPTPEPDDEQAPDSDDELRLQAQAELEDFLEERDELRLKRAKVSPFIADSQPGFSLNGELLPGWRRDSGCRQADQESSEGGAHRQEGCGPGSLR